MSDIPADRHWRLDIDEQIARIERSIEESGKLRDEATKLRAEAKKFDRERWIAPFTIIMAVLAAIVARLPEILGAFGVGK